MTGHKAIKRPLIVYPSMPIEFVTHGNDVIGVQAISALAANKYTTRILRDGEIQTPNGCYSIAFFTAPGLVKGKSLCDASHRIMKAAPLWTAGCVMVVAMKAFNLNAVLTTAMKLSGWDGVQELSHKTPWGQPPSNLDNFQLYLEWVRNCLNHNPDELGIIYRPPLKLKPADLRLLKGVARGYLNGPQITDLVRSVQNLGKTPDFEFISRVVRLISENVLSLKLFNVQTGLQLERLFTCIWRAYFGEPIELVAPACPAWSYDENGYTFAQILRNNRGVSYDMMVKRLEVLVKLLRSLPVAVNITIIIGDVEYFDVVQGSYQSLQEKMTEDEFMAVIATQISLIQEDVERRDLMPCEVQSFLEVFPRTDLLTRLDTEREKFISSLATSPWVQRYFECLLGLEGSLYAKQCGVSMVDTANPDPRIKSAIIDDVRLNLTLIALLGELYGSLNTCFFPQSDPFAGLYRDYPYVSWRVPRQGIF